MKKELLNEINSMRNKMGLNPLNESVSKEEAKEKFKQGYIVYGVKDGKKVSLEMPEEIENYEEFEIGEKI